MYSTRKLTQLCSDHETNTFWNFGVCAQHLLPSSLRHSPCLIHHFSTSSRSADPLASVSQGWFRPSDRDLKRHCQGFWERECSSLDLGCADMRLEAAWGILWPRGWCAYPGSRCEGWRETGPRDIFPLSRPDCPFWTLVILVGLKWYVTEVLVFIFLMANDIEHHLCACWPFVTVFGEMSVQFLCPFFNRVICLFCWIVRVRYIFWVHRYMIYKYFS